MQLLALPNQIDLKLDRLLSCYLQEYSISKSLKQVLDTLATDISSKKDKLRYRSKDDIEAQILAAAKEPKGKTKLMYSAMVSSSQTREYLAELLHKKSLSFNEVTKTYRTTEQGLEFLRLYEKIKTLGDLI
jgi:predicted transcriptional regulator